MYVIPSIYKEAYIKAFPEWLQRFDALYRCCTYLRLPGMKDKASGWSRKIHTFIVIIQITAGEQGRTFSRICSKVGVYVTHISYDLSKI